MQFKNAVNEAVGMADVVGTDDPHSVDWSSGKGPETDLGKRRKKKIVRRKLNNAGKMN